MSQERWDVHLRFLNGPLAYEGDLVRRGPVIRIGANPGPGGLSLEGYRGLDDRHAVITAYDGGSVSIAPVGQNQVRMAPHEHVEWGDVRPIRGPVYLSDGCAVHMGPPGRGATAVFVKAERLGVWEQRQLLSESAQAEPTEQNPSVVVTLDTRQGIPAWFLPGMLVIGSGFMSMLALIVFVLFIKPPERLGPVDDGKDVYDLGDEFEITEVNDMVLEGTNQAFQNFIMTPNIEASGREELTNNPKLWDGALLQGVARSMQMYIGGKIFWKKLDDHKDTYAMVLRELRQQGLPDVLAGVPFQESGYEASAWDPMACAAGLWQFQPEVAVRLRLEVSSCPLTGGEVYTPTQELPPPPMLKNAPYIAYNEGKPFCRIKKLGCAADERVRARESTIAAIKNFKIAMAEPDLRRSGGLTQMLIASHNAGLDDSPYRKGLQNPTNILIGYRKWMKEKNGGQPGLDYIGKNMTCTDKSQMDKTVAEEVNGRCGGYLPNVTQSYVPRVIAQHLLAVCYYGLNYGKEEAFKPYQSFVVGAGYCQKSLKVPTAQDVREWVLTR